MQLSLFFCLVLSAIMLMASMWRKLLLSQIKHVVAFYYVVYLLSLDEDGNALLMVDFIGVISVSLPWHVCRVENCILDGVYRKIAGRMLPSKLVFKPYISALTSRNVLQSSATEVGSDKLLFTCFARTIKQVKQKQKMVNRMLLDIIGGQVLGRCT